MQSNAFNFGTLLTVSHIAINTLQINLYIPCNVAHYTHKGKTLERYSITIPHFINTGTLRMSVLSE